MIDILYLRILGASGRHVNKTSVERITVDRTISSVEPITSYLPIYIINSLGTPGGTSGTALRRLERINQLSNLRVSNYYTLNDKELELYNYQGDI